MDVNTIKKQKICQKGKEEKWRRVGNVRRHPGALRWEAWLCRSALVGGHGVAGAEVEAKLPWG